MRNLFLVIVLILSLNSLATSMRGVSFQSSQFNLSYSHYYSKGKLSYIETPGCSASATVENGMYLKLIGLSSFIIPETYETDVLFGMGIGYNPKESIFSVGFDYTLSYKMVFWNNFSGYLKPNISILVPLYKNQKKKYYVNLAMASGIYYRYSYKLIGLLGNENFYKNRGGTFLETGLVIKLK